MAKTTGMNFFFLGGGGDEGGGGGGIKALMVGSLVDQFFLRLPFQLEV